MTASSDDPGEADHGHQGQGNLLILSVLTLIAGAVTGFVAIFFRMLLERADRIHDALIDKAQGHAMLGLLAIVALAVTASLLAALLVRR